MEQILQCFQLKAHQRISIFCQGAQLPILSGSAVSSGGNPAWWSKKRIGARNLCSGSSFLSCYLATVTETKVLKKKVSGLW